jgi:hypothetical protein
LKFMLESSILCSVPSTNFNVKSDPNVSMDGSSSFPVEPGGA